MSRSKALRRAVRSALLTSAAAAVALPVYAQETTIQEVVVTGSRIPQPNLEGPSPVSVIGAQDVRVQGVTQVEDLINNMPQAFADQGGNLANGASGTATVNLRNLGADRTLVLVNGRRLPAGTPRGPVAPDLNQIPAPLIERVEVLTGGASAVYGSDAVAGVVNFIMNSNFEGVQVDVNYNFYNHKNDNSVGKIVEGRGFATPPSSISADGESFEASLLMGSNFADGRGNATIFFGYREIDPLLQSERDYSACSLGSNAAGFICAGSGTSYPGMFFSNNADGLDIYGKPVDPAKPCSDDNPCFPNAAPRPNATLQDILANNGFTIADANGGTRPFTGSDVYNFGPLNYYQRPDERYSFSTFAHYDIADSATVYTELSFHDDRTVAQIAPSGLFGLITNISCDNPLLSAQQKFELCEAPTEFVPDRNADGTINYNGPGAHVPVVTDTASVFILRRNVEGGGRQDDIRHSSYRGVIGLRGEVGDNWNYDAYAQYGTVVYQETYLNDFSATRAARAMDVIADPDTGEAVCRSASDGTDPNCVPYNIWSLGGVTQEALAYMQTPGFQRGDTTQTVIGASLAADLSAYGLKLPSANEGVGVAFGVEYRDEGLTLRTDQAFETGDLFGQGGPTIGLTGSYNVVDLFMETRVPLLQGVTGAEQLTLSGSYRNSDYSTDKKTSSYGIGLDWSPVQSVKLRGSYQQAVRAANIIELFQAKGLGLYDMDFDPCAGPNPEETREACARTGVTPEMYGRILDNPAGQYNALFGGEPTLEPETSKSHTFGVVFTPAFLENFSLTVDYFNIKVEDQIDFISPTTTLTNCLETGDPLFCSLITRDSLGTLWATPGARIVATNLNLAKQQTSGYDLQVNYARDIGLGSLDVNLVGTMLNEFVEEPLPGMGSYDCAGLYGNTCGTPLPEWRHKLRATWITPWNLDLSLTWRHYAEVMYENTSSNALLRGPSNRVDRRLPAQNYLDLATAYTFQEAYTARLGINNLLDKDPPLSSQVGAGAGNGNTYPQVYDAFGRYVFLNLTAKF